MTGPYPATERQQAVLRFIYGYHCAHGGVSPCLREIAAGCGIVKSSALRLLICLEERGLVRRLRNRDRAIAILVPPTIPRAPDGAPLFLVPLNREIPDAAA